MFRRGSLRARLMASVHFYAGEDDGAGAGSIGDDGLPNDEAPAEKPAETPAALGDDGLPLDAPKDDGKPAAKEFVPDPKKTDDENAAAKKTHDDEAKLNAVPEGEYDFASIYEEHGLTPEQVNPELIASFNEEAKGAGLTQKQALAMARVQMKAQADYATKIATVRKDWLDTAKADKEIGSTNWQGSITAGRKAIAEFGSPALSKFFKDTGIGAHPEMIRFMSNVGKTLGEGRSEGGGGGATVPAKSAADVLYGG